MYSKVKGKFVFQIHTVAGGKAVLQHQPEAEGGK